MDYNMPPRGNKPIDRAEIAGDVYQETLVSLRKQIDSEKDQKVLLQLVATLILFNTGCRPNEAAYAAYHLKRKMEVVDEDAVVYGAVTNITHKITVPANFTKTAKDYIFYLDT